MKIGTKVTPISKAGLWLADVPTNGSYNQTRNQVCVFEGVGEIIDSHFCIIDYDEWERMAEEEPTFLGKRNCLTYLIKCKNGIGWGSAIKEVE